MPLPLVERSREDVARSIKKNVEEIDGVKGFRKVSVRMTGKRTDVEMRILLDKDLRFEDAHRIALSVERRVKNLVPSARVTIYTEPMLNGGEEIWDLVKRIAEGVPGSRGVHNIHIQEIEGKLFVDLHLEVSANMTVKQAHDVADQVEEKIRSADPKIFEITVHIESASDRISRELKGVEDELASFIEDVAKRFPEIKRVHDIEIRRVDDKLHVALSCHFDPDRKIGEVHELSNKLEGIVRSTYPRVVRIDVHEEPE